MIDKNKYIFSVILSLLALNVCSQGYVQDYNHFGTSLSIKNHHASILDNRENQTKFLSYSSNFNYSISISPLFNFNQQASMGFLQNASVLEDLWTKSSHISYSVGLSMNVPKFFARKFQGKVIPFANAGYCFNYYKLTSISRPNTIVSEFLVGGGVSIPLNNYLNCFAQTNINQRLGSDFQTSFNSQLGLNLLIIK